MIFNLNNENNKMFTHKGMMRLTDTYTLWLIEQNIDHIFFGYDGANEPHYLRIDDDSGALAFKLRFNV